MRKLSLLIAFIFILTAGCTQTSGGPTPLPTGAPANIPDGPTPEMSEWVTVDDLAPEVVELSFPLGEWGANMCADSAGNVWFCENYKGTIYKFDSERNESMFVQSDEKFTDIAYVDGRFFALTNSGIILYDDDGKETERHPLGYDGAWNFAPITNTDKVFISFPTEDVVGILYDLKTRVSEPLDVDFREVTNVCPLSNGEVVVMQHEELPVLMTPLKNRETAVKRGGLHFNTDYDAYTGVVYTFDGDRILVHQSLTEAGELLLYTGNVRQFMSTAVANDKLYTYAYTDETPKLNIYDFSVARPQAAMKTTLIIGMGGGFGKPSPVLWNDGKRIYGEPDYVSRFEKEHPNVKIKLFDLDDYIEYWPGDRDSARGWYFDKLYLDLVSGVAYMDLAVFSDYGMGGMTGMGRASGMFRDLNEFPEIRSMMDSDRLFDGVKELCTNDGTLFGVPSGVYIPPYIPNNELFARLGIPLPAPDWTWRDFLDIAEAAYRDQDGDGKCDIYLPFYLSSAFPDISGWAFNKKNNCLPQYNSPEYIEYAERYLAIQDLYNNQNGRADYYRFPEGDVLIGRLSYWEIEDYRKITEDTVILPSPRFFESEVYPNYLGITRNCKQVDLAAEFIAGFLSEEQHREYAGHQNMIYKDLSSYKKLGIPETAALEEFLQASYLKASPGASYPEGFSEWARKELFPRYTSGELTMEQCAVLMQQEAEKRLLG